MPHPPHGGHHGHVACTAIVERDSHSKLHFVLLDLAVTQYQLKSCSLHHSPTVCAHTNTMPLTLFVSCSITRTTRTARSCGLAHHGLFSDGRMPHGATRWNHSYYTGVRLSALHSPTATSWCSSSSPVQTLTSTHESNGIASSSSVSSPQLPHSAIRSQVLAVPTRNVTGDVMSATLAEAVTQFSFTKFLERCNFLRSHPPRLQPDPTLFLNAPSQTFPDSAASAEASTHLPLAEFFL